MVKTCTSLSVFYFSMLFILTLRNTVTGLQRSIYIDVFYVNDIGCLCNFTTYQLDPEHVELSGSCVFYVECDHNHFIMESPHAIQRVPSEDDRRSCWVCFATDDDDRTAAWVKPCKCRGTTKWVHQKCLQRWVDEKQRGNSTTKVACPQCNTEYLIVFPKLGPIVYVLDLADRIIYKTCPFLAGGILVGSVYWTAVTYGAVTVMQVLGHKEGLNVMEKADPLFLLIGLPTIPLMLILSKMVRWEDYILRLWRKHSTKIPLLSSILGVHSGRTPAETSPLSDPISATRVLCGALIMPTFATIVGKLMFSSVSSNFQRTLLGGIASITIKGVLRIYFKQQQYIRQSQRTILDYDDDLAAAAAAAANASNDGAQRENTPPGAILNP